MIVSPPVMNVLAYQLLHTYMESDVIIDYPVSL